MVSGFYSQTARWPDPKVRAQMTGMQEPLLRKDAYLVFDDDWIFLVFT